jgi:uncharacterized protein (TIGR03435 family)
MTHRLVGNLCFGRKAVLAAVCVGAAIGAFIPGIPLRAQSSNVPEWQIAAGGKMAFDVTSVKESQAPPPYSRTNMDVSGFDMYKPTGGVFRETNGYLISCLVFAYKLRDAQINFLLSELPKWATIKRYDIEGRGAADASKDQLRLMMQSLLADRFKLAVHFETRQIPELGLVLAKPGKLGPQIKPYDGRPPCPLVKSADATTPPAPKTDDDYVALYCGGIGPLPSAEAGLYRAEGRNLSMDSIAVNLSAMGSLGRPIVDRTGMTGTFDVRIEWMLGQQAAVSADPNAAAGPTFLEALNDQLGFKLEPTTGPVAMLVVDHVDEPSAN